jgi:hypothetical protein
MNNRKFGLYTWRDQISFLVMIGRIFVPTFVGGYGMGFDTFVRLGYHSGRNGQLLGSKGGTTMKRCFVHRVNKQGICIKCGNQIVTKKVAEKVVKG